MAFYGRQVPHITWYEWRELNPIKFRKYFKFAVVRDPVARFASAFYFLKSGGMNRHDRHFRDSCLGPFASANDLAKAFLDLEVQARVAQYWHFRRQADFVADGSGCPQVDLLIRFENLQLGFERVARRVNSAVRDLPHLNITPGHVDAEFDRESLEVLDSFYQSDFELWRRHAI
jgi:hypothetical protein